MRPSFQPQKCQGSQPREGEGTRRDRVFFSISLRERDGVEVPGSAKALAWPLT